VLALPVLAGTCAYVLAEALGWKGSLNLRFTQARGFYVSMLLCLALAVALTLVGISPIQFLFWSSLAGGLGTPITLALLMLVARNRGVMGAQRIGSRLAIGGWLVTAVVVTACVVFLTQTITSGRQ
jgi:Mn2+/Fe2+ NRAMP family transporter